MPVFDLDEFFKLSSALNYNLSAASLNRYNVLMYILAGKRLADDDQKDRESKGVLMEALGYLFSAYRQKRRRLGPMAVLHPLRAAALFTRSVQTVSLVDVLSVLLHDVLEDIESRQFDTVTWKAMESQLYSLLERLEQDDERRLTSNLLHLTRVAGESYYRYIARLLDNARNAPELVEVKLADRLDNTLDMRIDLEDPLAELDFFKTIFQLLFVNNYPGYRPKAEHSQATAINGARRLYQLFKNAVLLSLIRQYTPEADRRQIAPLCETVAEASLKEAQRTLIHLAGYHLKDVGTQRRLLLEAMQYCYSGRTDLVTHPGGEQLLDGLFSTYFGPASRKILAQCTALSGNKLNFFLTTELERIKCIQWRI